jgi:hypothetical protein
MNISHSLQALLNTTATEDDRPAQAPACQRGPSTNYDHEYSNPDGRSFVGMESVIVRLFVKDLIRGWFAKA